MITMVGCVLWLLHSPLVASEVVPNRDALLAALKDANEPALAALKALVRAKSEAHERLSFHGQAFEAISWEVDIVSQVPAAELDAALELCPGGQHIRCASEKLVAARVELVLRSRLDRMLKEGMESRWAAFAEEHGGPGVTFAAFEDMLSIVSDRDGVETHNRVVFHMMASDGMLESMFKNLLQMAQKPHEVVHRAAAAKMVAEQSEEERKPEGAGPAPAAIVVGLAAFAAMQVCHLPTLHRGIRVGGVG
jgi:hypothetical protein